MREMGLNLLDHPQCLAMPKWLEDSAWKKHIPFLSFVISATKPRIFVELGSFKGVSYCAACQAVESLSTGTKCFAVDTWKGDEHAGALEPETYTNLRAYHDPRYGHFSKLLKCTFDEALPEFEDGSVDLLHIDGLHTLEAVTHDFETWLPKMSPRGIILLHDINVYGMGFGVFTLWGELKNKYRSFSFDHGYGLGVLAVGSEIPEGVRSLFEANTEESDRIRRMFFVLGSRVGGVEAYRHRRRSARTFFRKHIVQSYPVNVLRILFKGEKGEFISKARKKLGI